MCRVASSPAFLSISTRSGSCRSTHSALACSLDRAGSGGSCACRRLSCLSAPLWHRQLDGGAWYGQTDVWSRFTRDQRRPWFVVALGRWRGLSLVARRLVLLVGDGPAALLGGPARERRRSPVDTVTVADQGG